MDNTQKALEEITKFYLKSGDFNGLPPGGLQRSLKLTMENTTNLVENLLHEELIDVMFGNVHPNPHIKAFSDIPHRRQLEFLASQGLDESCCIYPARKHLETLDLQTSYEGRPYELELALGEGQLNFRVFDLSVLEHYRNDPRYYYETNFVSGSISVTDEYFESASMPESDQVLLQTFGFAYDDNLNRAVAVFLRYLADLSPEHQRIWHAKQLQGDYKLHPDYYRSSILGDWPSRLSVFEAFPMELEVINAMTSLMGKAPFFRQTFGSDRPKDFGFLLRPTLAEFNAFVLLLDKMLSDNINKNFFEGDLELEYDHQRPDGKVEVKQKGTLTLFEEWLSKNFRPAEPEPLERMLKTLREIRKLRQKPAHSINENVFDIEYFKEQRRIVMAAYGAVRILRLVLANHPAVRRNPPEINELLMKGEIWDR